MTKQEFEFLVRRVEEMYCGDPNVDGVRALLDHIGAPYGFTVEDALETSPRRRVSDGLSSSGSSGARPSPFCTSTGLSISGRTGVPACPAAPG